MHVGGQIIETSDDGKDHQTRKRCGAHSDVTGERPGCKKQTERRHKPEDEHLEKTSHLHQAGDCATALQSKDGSGHGQRRETQRQKNACRWVDVSDAGASREHDSEADEEVHEHSSKMLHVLHVIVYLMLNFFSTVKR